MPTRSLTLYRTPFSAAYWRDALADFHTLRNLVFAALMTASCIVLSYFSLPVHESLKISWGFLARALCSLVCGPVMAPVFGFVEDTLSFVIKPQGAYFPGYALTTMLGNLIYAFFFYRAKITVSRVFAAKLCTNILNVLLGSLWSAILYSKGYLYYMTTSLVKNTIMLPIQAMMLVVLFSALLPILTRAGLLPDQGGTRLELYDRRRRTA